MPIPGCIPRPEVLYGTLDDAIFAAELRYVVAGTAPTVYQDPRVFFRNTYPTQPLKNLASSVFQRLANPQESGALIRLSTGFGGGKTHAMLTLWHLAKNMSDPSLGEEFVSAHDRPNTVAVAAIDGQVGGSQEFARHGQIVTRTLWGELAYQLGGERAHAAIANVDNLGESPSDHQLESIFPSGPVLILLDELVTYIASLPEGRQDLVISFLQRLFGICRNRRQTVVVVSDPAGQEAYRKQTERLIEMISKEEQAAKRLDQVLSRLVTDLNPVGDESAQVVIRRLFEQVDPDIRARVARDYREFYERVLRDHPGNLNPSVATDAYAARIRACFPFHPRLFETAEQRLSALPDFQRGRGTLRLFARLVRSVWRGPTLDLITAADLDWSDADLRGELLARLNREGFEAAVKADIEGHAAELDGGNPRQIHQRVLSALLLDSLPLGEKSGLNRQEVTLTTLRLDDSGDEPIEAMERLESVCWHLYPWSNDEGWQLKLEPNVIREIEERKASIRPDDVRPRVLAIAQQYFNGASFQLVAWPSNARSVPESARLTLALCDSEQVAREVVSCSDVSNPNESMPRRFINAIVAIAPTSSALTDAIEHARRLVAGEQVQKERQRSEGYQLIKRQLEHYLTTTDRAVRRQTCRAFTTVIVGDHAYSLPEQYQFPTDEALGPTSGGQAKLREFLETHELLYREGEALDPYVLLTWVLPGATPLPDHDGVWTAKAVHERLLATSGLRLIPREKFVLDTIRKAVMEGKLVLRTEEGEVYHGESRVFGPPGARRRTTGRPPLGFPLTDQTLVALPESAAASEWLAEDRPQARADGERGELPEPPPPPPPSEAVGIATSWETAIRLADEGRPLRELMLVISRPEMARAALQALPILGAPDVTLRVTVTGTLRGGGEAGLKVSGVKPSHPMKPLEVAATLVHASEHASYEAALTLRFAEGHVVAGGTLQEAARLAGEVAVRAQFGEAPS